MARYSLNLPADLKIEAERLASEQEVSLNQFILWALAEHVGSLSRRLDDPRFPRVGYRKAENGPPVPVLRRTGVRVKTLVIAHQDWEMEPREIAQEFGLTTSEVKEALRFSVEHREEIARETAAEEETVQEMAGVSA